MKIQRIALTAAIAFVACAIVASLVWWLSGDDEARATGSCSGATYQLESEREDNDSRGVVRGAVERAR